MTVISIERTKLDIQIDVDYRLYFTQDGIRFMLKRYDLSRPLAAASGQLAMGAGVVRYVWGHPANVAPRVRAVLRAVRYQAQARPLRQHAMARLDERSRLSSDLHHTAAPTLLTPIACRVRCWCGDGRNGTVASSLMWDQLSHVHDLGRRAWRRDHRYPARRGTSSAIKGIDPNITANVI